MALDGLTAKANTGTGTDTLFTAAQAAQKIDAALKEQSKWFTAAQAAQKSVYVVPAAAEAFTAAQAAQKL